MRFRRSCWACIVLALVVCAPLPRLQAQTPAASTQRRPTSTPYTGDLSIFETPGRDQRLHIDQVMDILAIGPGKTVADIGAGSGWFTVRAARRVTGTGMVYAVDINPKAITCIDSRAAKEQLHNVKTVLGNPDDPKLPANSIDAVLLLKVYHEVAEPVALLRNLRTALRPGARLGIIDREGDGEDHGVHKSIVVQEAAEAGYQVVEEHDGLVKADNVDYFLVLEAKQ
ncbi:MAG TPA: class I SAM-dependent methyltransferase [Candidatus Binatia bacterium]|nr:class I SAM-dependent methyltransferase [Candidatus Binatia bacterium]